MRHAPPKPPKGGFKRRKKASERHFIVNGVNLGDGKTVKVKLSIGPNGALVRQYHSRTKWYLSMVEVAESIARRSQVLVSYRKMGIIK